MRQIQVPTSRDIFIEAGGRRVGVVESYRTQAVRELYEVEALGSASAVGVVSGPARYRLELRRILLADGVDFHSLEEFQVVIVKPGERILYTGCEWEQISEGVSVGQPCVEAITLIAKRRIVLK